MDAPTNTSPVSLRIPEGVGCLKKAFLSLRLEVIIPGSKVLRTCFHLFSNFSEGLSVGLNIIFPLLVLPLFISKSGSKPIGVEI